MKAVLSLIIYLIPSIAFACPACAGSMDNPKDNITVLVLAGFILAIYIPFYLIYSMIYKNRKLNNSLHKNEQ